MSQNKFFSGVALTALSVIAGGNAFAQSTGSQVFEEELVVVGQRQAIDGVVRQTAPKAVVGVNSDFIDTQAPGQTILQSINLLPGVNFTNNDAYGSAGGNLNIRGLDGARISLTFDGTQLNDSGNYAIYPNQMLDPELIERASVNLGATDTDSPTASATGGTVNYVTRKPTDEAQAILQYSTGSNNFIRPMVILDTGYIGDTGIKAFGSFSKTEYSHFLGNAGGVDKKQYNARIYKDIGENGDFLSLSLHYNENRNQFIRNYCIDEFNEKGLSSYENNVVNNQCGTNLRHGPNDVAAARTSLNPSNTGNIRGQSRFSLTEKLTLTIDPTFQYVLANGGSTRSANETNTSLVNNYNSGLNADLNGDGDTLDTNITYFRPNTTNTRRYSVTSSLIYDMNEDQRIRFSWTYDKANHRQTGDATYMRGGVPESEFAGKDGWGSRIPTSDGSNLRRRDRFSVASLNQFSAEYRGNFMEDMLTVVAGLRAPTLTRELNNYCFQPVGGFDPICTYNAGAVATLNANPAVVAPFQGEEVEYTDVLPNLGLTFRPVDSVQLFVAYAENLSAPRTDDLYGVRVRDLARVQPETSNSYDAGVRYQTGTLNASVIGWYKTFDNRIERTYDVETDTSGSYNIGAIDMMGVDFQVGAVVLDNFTATAFASWQDSELQNDIRTSSTATLATKGKRLYDAPEWMFGGRFGFELGDFSGGVQAKYTGERFSNLLNNEVVDAFTTVDADVRWNFGDLVGRPGTFLQINAINLLDEEYLGNISTDLSGNRSAQIGAPQTFTATIRTQF